RDLDRRQHARRLVRDAAGVRDARARAAVSVGSGAVGGRQAADAAALPVAQLAAAADRAGGGGGVGRDAGGTDVPRGRVAVDGQIVVVGDGDDVPLTVAAPALAVARGLGGEHGLRRDQRHAARAADAGALGALGILAGTGGGGEAVDADPCRVAGAAAAV